MDAVKKDLASLGIALVALVVVAGIVYAAAYYRAGGNGQITNVNEYGICKDIVNNNAKDLFVPTKTVEEYNSLITNGAPNVSFLQCVPPQIQLCSNFAGSFSPYGDSVTLWPDYQNSCAEAHGTVATTFNGTVGCGPASDPDSKYDWTGSCTRP